MSDWLKAAARGRRAILPTLVVIFLSAPSPASAQSGVHGFVMAPQGQVADHFPLTLRNVTTGATWTTKSSMFGTYLFEAPPGDYIVAANVDPFVPIEVRVTLVPGLSIGVDIHLRFRREEEVVVRVPTSTDGQLTSFSSQFIDAAFLPNGRTIQSLLASVPGVVFTETVGTLAQFTAVGQRRFANRLTIDGISADLAADTSGLSVGEAASGALPAVATSGGTQTLVPLDAIGETTVRTVNADTAHAQTPGAQTTVVTRAGTNRFSASAFATTRPDSWAARDWFANAGLKPRREVRYANLGASAGGPLAPRRLFYLFAWERQDIDRLVTNTVAVPSQSLRDSVPDIVRPLLDAYPTPTGPDVGQGLAQLTHRFPTRSHLSVVSLRSDLRATDAVRGFLRLNWGRSSGDAVGGTRLQAPFPAYTRTETALTRTATAGLNAYGSGWAHEARLNLSVHRGGVVAHAAAYGDAAPIPFGLLAPASSSETDTAFNIVLFPGPAGFNMSGPLARTTQTQVQVTDTWSIGKGRHSWMMGIDFRQVWLGIDPFRRLFGYRFRGAQDLVAGRPAQVTIVHGAAARVSTPRWSAFVEDTVRLSPRTALAFGLRLGVQPAPVDRTRLEPLTFNFGALPEVEQRPSGTPLWPTQVNLAPRLALTYQLGRSAGRESTLRTGWGVVFDEMNPGAKAFGNGYPYVVIRSLGLLPFPVADDVLAARDVFPAPFETGGFGEYYAFAHDLRSPRTYAWHAGIDQSLGQGQLVSVTYAGSMGRDLIYRHEYFHGAPGNKIHAYTNAATSDYHALLVNYSRRLSRALEGRVTYAWSHAIDIDSGETLTDQPPPGLVPLASNRGSSDFDRRHVLHAWASYRVQASHLPAGLKTLCGDWQIDATVIAQSGAPVSITDPRALGQTEFYVLRPDLVRNVPLWISDSSSPGGRRLNPTAFTNPQEMGQGTLGRNTIRGFPLRQLNLALARRLPFAARAYAGIRLEVFNVFNTPSFGPPLGELGAQSFGRSVASYAETLGTGSLTVGGLVPLQQAGGPRAVQVTLRVGL